MKKSSFTMRVHDIFQLPDKTVFVGIIDAQVDFLGAASCTLLLDGLERARLRIEGETLFRPRERALWSRERLELTKDEWMGKVVVLRSDD
ncbi:MAG: hypothetical protein KIS78_04490 [Labilithrix sp.]|nr:hypothetical protein [Labilithrix sp.]